MSATIFALPDPDRTVIIESVPFQTEDVIEAPFPVEEAAPDASVARLEQKLDQALRMLAVMQQRIDSLDATLMRVLMR
ncbi:MAG TPA: hypothetical protein VF266_08670 [Thermoanaerobaculia bacterium]